MILPLVSVLFSVLFQTSTLLNFGSDNWYSHYGLFIKSFILTHQQTGRTVSFLCDGSNDPLSLAKINLIIHKQRFGLNFYHCLSQLCLTLKYITWSLCHSTHGSCISRAQRFVVQNGPEIHLRANFRFT